MKKVSLIALLIIGLSVLFGLSVANTAAALSGTGYFTGRTGSWTSGYGGDVLSGRPTRNALQPGNYDTKQHFIDFIKNKLANGNTQDKTGAAFIINLMLASGGLYGKTKNPPSVMITDWENRIKDPNMLMYSVYGDPNSYGSISFYDSRIVDDFFSSTYYNASSRDLLIFKSGGVVRFVVEVPCGNPIGGLPGLPPNWTAVPKTSASKSQVEAGTDATWSHSVTLQKGRSDRLINWEIRYFEKSSITDPNLTGSLDSNGTIAAKTSPGTVLNVSRSMTTDLSMVGKYICQYIRVQPQANNLGTVDNNWRASTPICVEITVPPPPPPGPMPEVQFWGYDMRTNQRAVTSTITNSGTRYGSWGEYGIYTGAENLGLASGAGLNNGSTNPSSLNQLTFANTGPPPCSTYGCYGPTSTPTELINTLQSRCPASYASTTTGDTIDIDSSTYPQFATPYGGVIYICTHGSVTIKSDITYSNGNTNDIGGLPQVVIIANKILISRDVKRVDAWLLALTDSGAGGAGKISTCEEVVGPSNNHFSEFGDIELQDTTCPDTLVVNGPVITDELYLYRTTDPGLNGTPAEIFNLRADAFLWAYGGASTGGSSVAQTIAVQEVPPRF